MRDGWGPGAGAGDTDAASRAEAGSLPTIPGRAARPRPGDGGPAPFEVGTVLGGRYELLAPIGQGGFGMVYRAHDQVADEVVAIKVLTASPSTPRALERLRQELRAARTVSHPGVVRLHDVIDLGGQLALSMELIEGETLDGRLRRGPVLDAAELGELALDVAKALAAAHRAGVVHRDLKPDNIILRAGTGRPVITDFGISRLARLGPTTESGPPAADPPAAPAPPASPEGRLTRDGELMGTPPYMAPEQLRGSREVGPPADVYALGVVLFEAATGTRPHEGASPADLVLGRLERPAPSLATLRPDLPAYLVSAVDRCLEGDPADRFPSGSELRAALGGPVTGVRRRPSSWRGRRPLALAVAACALAALLGAVLWSRAALPGRDRRLLILVENRGPAADGWLARAAARMAARTVRQREVRFLVVDDPARANVVLRLTLRRTPAGAALEGELGPIRGFARALPPARAPSVAAALAEILPAAAARLGAGQAARGPDLDERMEMARLGTASFEAYHLYQRVLYDAFSVIFSDTVGAERDLERVIALDPGWAHPYALLAHQQGRTTPAARATYARARAALGGSPRDPAGRALLGALERVATGQDRAAVALVLQAWEQTGDVLAGCMALGLLQLRDRVDEAISVTQRLHREHPELQFGADLAGLLSNAGRSDEIAPMLDGWLARAPDSEQALTSHIAADIDRGRVTEAEAWSRDLLLLHGEAGNRLVLLCDVLIYLRRLGEARTVANRLLQGSPHQRAGGRYRLGVIAILEGRFAAAYDSLEAAAVASRPLGFESEIVQILEALASVAPLVGRAADVERHLGELATTFEAFGAPGAAAEARFQQALARIPRAGCPAVDGALAGVPAGPARTTARRHMLRLAAHAGCGTCAEAVRAGLAADERTTAPIFRYGVCAEQEGNLQLAADALERARLIKGTSLDGNNGASPYYSVLARFHLGRVYARLGRAAEARVEHEHFVDHWGHADRPVPEVDEARRALAPPR